MRDPDSLESRMTAAFWEHARAVIAAIREAGYAAHDIEWGSGPLGRDGWTCHYAEMWSRGERRMLGKVWVAVVERPFAWEYLHEIYLP